MDRRPKHRGAPSRFALFAFAAFFVGCASVEVRRSQRIVVDPAGLPDDVAREVLDADAACSSKENALIFDYQDGKKEQEGFKTTIGSITGAVGTAGGIAGGVGAFVASEDDVKTVTAITGFIGGGLGAVGTIITAVVSPGAEKMESSAKQLDDLEKKKAKARAALAKAPADWNDEDREKWTSARKELAESCR